MWPQEYLLAWPVLDQREARWVTSILKYGDPTAIGFDGLDRGYQMADFELGRSDVLRKRTIADKDDRASHTCSELPGVVPNA